jgi:hypothetical protein
MCDDNSGHWPGIGIQFIEEHGDIVFQGMHQSIDLHLDCEALLCSGIAVFTNAFCMSGYRRTVRLSVYGADVTVSN